MLRITGGQFKGRTILTPDNLKTRPTQAKLRQALFNSLQVLVPDSSLLDLFSGSGALGFEALSRGASRVTFVESSRVAVQMIFQNAESLGVRDRIAVISDSVISSLERIQKLGPYDVILADPPYENNWETTLLNQWPWSTLLNPEGIFCLEWGALKSKVSELPEQGGVLRKIREKKYGDSILTTYKIDETINAPAVEQ